MDAISVLASSVVGVLAPYLVKAGESLASEAGKAAGNKISGLYTFLKARLQNKPSANEALSDLVAKPKDEDAQAALRQQLKKHMNADASLVEELRKLVDEVKEDKETYSFLTQVYGGKVGDIFNIGKVDTLNIH